MIEVTSEQYLNLISARNNWPRRLSYQQGSDEDGEPGCGDVFLARHAGVIPGNIIDYSDQRDITGITWEAELAIEEHYGLDRGAQASIASENDGPQYRFNAERRRAKAMKRKFGYLIDHGVIVVDPEITPEVYFPEMDEAPKACSGRRLETELV